MKIAIIAGIFFPHPGGAQVQIHNLANKLSEKKVEVDCYIFDKADLKNNNYKIILLNKLILNFVFILKYYFNLNLNFILKIYLNKIIKKKRYDIWHFNFVNYKSLILIDCLKDLKQKILVTFQGVDIQINKEIKYGYRLDKKYEKYLKKILDKIDNFSCLSNTIKKDLLNLNVPLEKICIIPNAVEIEKFKKFKIDRVKNDKINLITVARFSEKKKGFDLLPELVEKLLELKLDFHWNIIGKNTKKLFEKSIIKKNSEKFTITDDLTNFNETYLPSSNLINKYMCSDIYLNLSRIESFGITFVEALASGIPVVSFDTKGVNEIIKNQYNGYIIEGNKLDSISKKIVEIAHDRSLIKILEVGIVNSSKNYDLNLVTNKFLTLYKTSLK
jgi:glycosyltransferase involved in cell wall biosynthesis